MIARHEYQHIIPMTQPRQPELHQLDWARVSYGPYEAEATGGPAYLLITGAVVLGAIYLARH